MSSLDRHLTTHHPSAHSRLPFRGDCPLCARARAHGQAPPAELVPQRAAALVAGALTLAAATPSAALAATGTLPPAGTAPASTTDPAPYQTDNVAHDEPRAPAPLPRQAALKLAPAATPDPSDESGAHPDATSPPAEPAAGTTRVSADTSDQAAPAPVAPPARQHRAAPAPVSTPVHAAQQPRHAPTSTSTPAPAAPNEARSAPPPAHNDPEPTRTSTRPSAATASPRAAAPARAPTARAPAKPAGAATPAASRRAGRPTATPASSSSSTRADDGAPRSGDRPDAHATGASEAASTATPAVRRAPASTHTVARGESLWLIAERRLRADASDAAVAREVNRLWRLNQPRLHSGTPDLIYPGEELRT